MKTTSLLATLATALLVSACASQSAGSYGRAQAQREMTVRFGIVDSVRAVTIEGTKSPVGAGAGAVIGGIAGGRVGQGHGSDVATVLGAIAGGLAGAAIENKATAQQGVEITIKLENGSYIAVTQAADEVFQPGERVRILSDYGTTRVTH